MPDLTNIINLTLHYLTKKRANLTKIAQAWTVPDLTNLTKILPNLTKIAQAWTVPDLTNIINLTKKT